MEELLNQIHHCSATDLLSLLPDNSVQMQFFDPPYGKNYSAGDKRWKRAGKRRFSSKTFEDIADTSFLSDAYRVLKSGGAAYLCTQWDTMHIWQQAMIDAGYNVKSCLVWDKGIMGQGDTRYFGTQTEFILFGVKGDHKLNWQKRESNIWYIPRIDVINIDGNFDNPTQKPTTLVKMAIERSSKIGDIVMDLHCGTGTTPLSAKQTKRQYIACDISLSQVQIARSRLKLPVTEPMFTG